MLALHVQFAVPENSCIHNHPTPPPLTEGIGISWWWEGGMGRLCKTKAFKEMYEALLEFP